MQPSRFAAYTVTADKSDRKFSLRSLLYKFFDDQKYTVRTWLFFFIIFFTCIACINNNFFILFLKCQSWEKPIDIDDLLYGFLLDTFGVWQVYSHRPRQVLIQRRLALHYEASVPPPNKSLQSSRGDHTLRSRKPLNYGRRAKYRSSCMSAQDSRKPSTAVELGK